ncbi:hypothetical protein M3J09_000564 [Ascochyta lentis]
MTALQTAWICAEHNVDFPIYISSPDTKSKPAGKKRSTYNPELPARTDHIPTNAPNDPLNGMPKELAFPVYITGETLKPSAVFGAFRATISKSYMKNRSGAARASHPWFNGIGEAFAWHEQATEKDKVQVFQPFALYRVNPHNDERWYR